MTAIAAVALRLQAEQLSEPRAVLQCAVAFQFAFTWINRRLGRITAPRAHFASASRIFTYRLWKSSARTWELRGAAPPCSGTVFEVNASILYGSIPRATEVDSCLEEPPQRLSVTHLVVNLQLADKGLDGAFAPAVPAARTE